MTYCDESIVNTIGLFIKQNHSTKTTINPKNEDKIALYLSSVILLTGIY
jgi:hypothetical protein